MKNADVFNRFFTSTKDSIPDLYDKEVRAFQKKHNHDHPDRHIWRHILAKRTFRFFLQGKTVLISVEIVRFVYAYTTSTFTFYGSLFLRCSSYSASFIRQAIDNPDEPFTDSIPLETIQRWRKLSLPPVVFPSTA